jgi:hypothetical protein
MTHLVLRADCETVKTMVQRPFTHLLRVAFHFSTFGACLANLLDGRRHTARLCYSPVLASYVHGGRDTLPSNAWRDAEIISYIFESSPGWLESLEPAVPQSVERGHHRPTHTFRNAEGVACLRANLVQSSTPPSSPQGMGRKADAQDRSV